MKHLFLSLTILAFLCFAIACQQGEKVANEPKIDDQGKKIDILRVYEKQ